MPAEWAERARNLVGRVQALAATSGPAVPAARGTGPDQSAEDVRAADFAPVRDEARHHENLEQRIAAACDDKGPSAVIGDSLTLRVFERGHVPTGPDGADAELVAFERLDLGTTSEVGIDGTVSLPMLGRVPVADRSLACAESELAAQLFDLMGVEGAVTIGFASRPPVLVVGPVARPGSYSFSLGMTVDRAVTEAGQLIAEAPSHAAQLGVLMDRREELDVSENALVLERARHEAILSGHLAIAVDGAAEDGSGPPPGRRAIERENSLVEAARAEEAARRVLDEQRRTDLARRIGTLRDTLNTAERELDYLRTRRDRLEGLLNSGAVTSEKHEQAMVAFLAAERVALERRDALTSAENDLARIDLEAAMARAAEREARLHTARDVDVELARVRAQIRQLDTRIAEIRGGRGSFTYTIERTTPVGPLSLAAVGSTRLQPGDLLRIEPAEERVDTPAARSDNGPTERQEGRG